MGKSFDRQGDTQRARAVFEQAVEILQSFVSGGSVYACSFLALTLRSLGDLLVGEDDWSMALAYYHQCKMIQKDSIGVEAAEFALTEYKIQKAMSLSRPSQRSKLSRSTMITEAYGEGLNYV